MYLHQHIAFSTSPDGTRIATAAIGRGPPLVRAAHWLSHVEFDADSPVWCPWLVALSRDHRYLRYDQRGCGLSDRDVTDVSLAAMVADLEAVTDELPGPFPLIGMSQGGAVAIEYARRHPDRVSHLVLIGAYARGALRRPAGKGHRQEAEALLALVRLGWGRDNPAFRQVFTNQFIPGGTPEQHRWWTELERRTASPETAAAILSAFYQIDVIDAARALDLPVLVMHSRGDARVPFDEGRLLAELIPRARFVPMESDNHVLLPTEPAWPRFLAEMRGFLLGAPLETTQHRLSANLTPAEAKVFEHVVEGVDNRTIAARIGKSEKTVRNQVSAILSKTGHPTRAALIAALNRSR
jgi:pimeloyl-ACP methyl ester carboxylesterase/DNA-binding CsgD family transcriptional regulator